MIRDLSTLSAGRPKLGWAAAVFLLLAMVASVTLGPQLAVWPSGPALLFLAIAAVLAIPLGARLPWPVAVTGLTLVGWIGFRAATSPVAEFAMADGVLLASCVAVFWVVRALLVRRGAIEILFTGLGVLVLVNWLPLSLQMGDSSHVFLLPRATETFPSGFFTYYGDCAAFLLGMALLSGGLVWDARRARWFRIFMGVVAVAAAAGVVFTKARGGIIGLGAGAAVLLVLAPWLTLRRGSRWLGATALVLPLLVIGAVVWLGQGLEQAQEARGVVGGGVLDNAARLFWWKLAASCIAVHPWAGGGSRSFSWENLQFWEAGWEKFSDAEPEFVHNEWLQMTTDYGLIGLLLLLLFFGAVIVAGVVARWRGEEAKAGTAVFVAGLAALAGLSVHAGFHFVFHVPPAALLLGVALAAILETARDSSRELPRRNSLPGAIVPVAAAGVLGYFGLKAAAVFKEMAPLRYHYGQSRPSLAEAMARVENAARVMPGHDLHLLRGKLAQQSAAGAPGAERGLLLEIAESAFRETISRHPHDPEPSVNLANVLSAMARDDEAEREFERAIRLQGGLERGFRARFAASAHYFRKSLRLQEAGESAGALESLIKARDVFDATASPSLWEYGEPGREHRLALARHLGQWFENLGRHEEAAAEFDRAVQISGGVSFHFFAARNLAAWGDAVWLEREPEAAMRKFRQARSRTNEARGMAPEGFSPTDIVGLAHELDRKIDFLEGAGIRPEPEDGER